MHRHRDLRLDHLREPRGLMRTHRVRAVADRQERDVGLDRVELGRVVRVAGVVVGAVPQRDDVADPPVLLRVRGEPMLDDVVGGHGGEAEPAHVVRLTRGDRRDVAAQLLRYVVRRDELRRSGREPLDLFRLEVILVRVRDQDPVGRRRVRRCSPRIDVDGSLGVSPPERRLPEPRDRLEHGVFLRLGNAR